MNDKEVDLKKWPAHALGRSCAKSNACVVNGRIVSLTEVETKLRNVVPKPKFLNALETKICNDLKNIQSDDRDLRFQTFKEAFQAFIHELKTYKPLLSRIYKEYEDYTNFYKAEAQKLRPVKEYLWTISQECDERSCNKPSSTYCLSSSTLKVIRSRHRTWDI
ncbi:Translin-associated factor X-interacting protein [Schistosoma japonicum]|uniref:Translin-associated factor X-interacting protein n=1 Tax=Schistosoma japonicum TaxID=6182 RepID=A0A4Z2CVV3_SCHJA|nr:Translin-associated factor X-interacting protein [Schistosoma japonicum]